MKQALNNACGCVVENCIHEGKVPLCSGEIHLCNDHFDHWVVFLRENPLHVEKWSTENYSVWNKHFLSFVNNEVHAMSHCTGS